MAKKKFGYFFNKSFSLRNKKEREEYIKENVFNNVNFQDHVSKVSMMLDIDKLVIEDVLTFYFTKIYHMCGTISQTTRYINIIGFLKLTIKPGNRI